MNINISAEEYYAGDIAILLPACLSFACLTPPVPRTCCIQVKHYAPSAEAQETQKASEILFTIFKSVLAECGIKLENLAGGTTDSGPDVKAMCINFLLAVYKIWWDWCSCHLADKAAEHAFGTSADPQKSKNKEARQVVQLVIKAAAKVNQSSTFKQKFEETQLDMLNQVLKISKHAPQRWLSLVRVMERIIRLWHVLRQVYVKGGEECPLDKENNKDDILQLYSLLQPLAAITRDGQYGAVPMTAEIHMSFADLKKNVLDPTKPLRVFDIPAAPDSPEAEKAEEEHRGQKGKPPLPHKMVEPGELRPVTVKTREELNKALVQRMYSRIWDDDAADPSMLRDSSVILTPSYNNRDYLHDLGLTAADADHLPASKKHLAPTLDTEAHKKYGDCWAGIKTRALEAARTENSRAAESGTGGQPPLKRPRLLESTLRAKGPRFASYGRGGARSGTQDAEEPDSEDKQLTQQVDAEIERYNGLYIRADEVRRIGNGFKLVEDVKRKGAYGPKVFHTTNCGLFCRAGCVPVSMQTNYSSSCSCCTSCFGTTFKCYKQQMFNMFGFAVTLFPLPCV